MKIGFTCSTFDLLHAGHVLMLKECKDNCDYLLVGLQVDPSLDRPEKNVPIQNLVERYTQLKGVKFVDEIIPYVTEKDLLDILNLYKIDIRFVGEEYKVKGFTGHHLPIEIFYNKRKHRFSSSELRERIKND